jgi:hypothetical protein
MMRSPNLDLNPRYQRDVVWASDCMSKLIDSLLCNYYVPPRIFNVIEVPVDGDGAKTRDSNPAVIVSSPRFDRPPPPPLGPDGGGGGGSGGGDGFSKRETVLAGRS